MLLGRLENFICRDATSHSVCPSTDVSCSPVSGSYLSFTYASSSPVIGCLSDLHPLTGLGNQSIYYPVYKCSALYIPLSPFALCSHVNRVRLNYVRIPFGLFCAYLYCKWCLFTFNFSLYVKQCLLFYYTDFSAPCNYTV